MHRLYRDMLFSPLPNRKIVLRFPVVYADVRIPAGYEVLIDQSDKTFPAVVFYKYLYELGEEKYAYEVYASIVSELDTSSGDEWICWLDFCHKYVMTPLKWVNKQVRFLRHKYGKQEIRF